MSILAIIVGVISAIPQFLSIVMDIISLINKLHPTQRGAALAQLKDAYNAAVAGNASSLNDLHNQLSNGTIGSPPDLSKE